MRSTANSTSKIIKLNNASLQVLNFIAEGSYAKVYLGRYKNNGDSDFKEVAIKRLEEEEDCQSESATMTTLQAYELPYLVKMIDYNHAKQILVLEYMQNGTLADFISKNKNCDWGACLQILSDSSEGLFALHEHEYLHLDIKSRNILLDQNNRAKLGDFGQASHESKAPNTPVGTPIAMAPEVWARPATHSKKSDIYALGVLILEVAAWHEFDSVSEYGLENHRVPYFNVDWQLRLKLINEFIITHCPIDIGELIHDCMQISPQDRPSTEEVRNRLAIMNKIHGEVRQVFFAHSSPLISDKIAGMVREYAVETSRKTHHGLI